MTPHIRGYHLVVTRQFWYQPSPPFMRGPGPVNKYQRRALSHDLVEKSILFRFHKRHAYFLLLLR
jgi:hypothetical protein